MNSFRLYLRNAHVVIQFMVLLSLALLGVGLLSSMGLLACKTFFNADLEAVQNYISNPQLPGASGPLKLLQIFTTIGLFLLPAMAFSQVFSNRPERFLQLNGGIKVLPIIGALFLIITFTPITDVLTWINNQLHLPAFLSEIEDGARESSKQVELLIGSYLAMDSFPEFLYNLFLLAILPAFAEEFFFRGVMQNLIIRTTNRVHLSVWITGLAFAIMHNQLFALLPLWILGSLLGYLKEWTGSLWTSIIAHFINNATIVIVMYFFDFNMADLESLSSPNALYLIGGIVLSAGIIFWFWKNRTPRIHPEDDLLIEDTPDDYSGM
jgi:membrane protease YdiL (CAAX protease family)